MIFTTARNKVIRYGQRKTKQSEMPDSKADPAASDSSDLAFAMAASGGADSQSNPLCRTGRGFCGTFFAAADDRVLADRAAFLFSYLQRVFACFFVGGAVWHSGL